jgi:hypothetical protein
MKIRIITTAFLASPLRFFQYNTSNCCPSLLQQVRIRIPAQKLRNSSTFSCFSSHWPSTGCVHAANAVCRFTDIFRTAWFFLNNINWFNFLFICFGLESVLYRWRLQNLLPAADFNKQINKQYNYYCHLIVRLRVLTKQITAFPTLRSVMSQNLTPSTRCVTTANNIWKSLDLFNKHNISFEDT